MINAMKMFFYCKFSLFGWRSYGVYISQLIKFTRVCSHVEYYNAHICLTAKLLEHGYRYHKLRKAFSKFYLRQHNWFQNSMLD